MRKFSRLAFSLMMVAAALAFGPRSGQAAEARFALVIGNDDYKAAKLATPANDAGLVAEALQTAGFTVTGARNLDQATMRDAFREFLGQVSAAGPDAVALVYLAGFGLQFEGENYFVPVDADIQHDVDVPLQAIRVSDLLKPLAALPGRVKIVILDGARENPFARGGEPLASGLALVDPIPGVTIAFNAAPGTVGPNEQGPYGAYATALTEMIAAGGLGLDDIFARVRLRVSELTQGAEVPWSVSAIDGPFFMTERAADAPPPPNVTPLADLRDRPLRDFPNVDDAYAAALDRDSIEGYRDFLAIYPSSPYSRRVAAMLAVRREEIIWRRALIANAPPAYWSYLGRYPHGPHVWDARRRLGMLGAPPEPPPSFSFYDFGVPPPPPDELTFVDQPVLIFEGSGFQPPPPPPVAFLPPRPREFTVLPPPPPPRERFLLPAPAAIPVFVGRPPSGGPVGARPSVPISLPSAVQHGGPPGAPEQRRPGGPGGPAAVVPPHPGAAPAPPVATIKPGALPPPPPSAPPPTPPGSRVPATLKPAPLPPAPSRPVTTPALVKPAPAPPAAARPGPALKPAPSPATQSHPGPTPAAVKPAPPPPVQSHPAPAPVVAKPAPPPPRPPAPSAAPVRGPPPPPQRAPAKPTCPPGKTATPQGCK
jgi:uncharacterized caspase-like protein